MAASGADNLNRMSAYDELLRELEEADELADAAKPHETMRTGPTGKSLGGQHRRSQHPRSSESSKR